MNQELRYCMFLWCILTVLPWDHTLEQEYSCIFHPGVTQWQIHTQAGRSFVIGENICLQLGWECEVKFHTNYYHCVPHFQKPWMYKQNTLLCRNPKYTSKRSHTAESINAQAKDLTWQKTYSSSKNYNSRCIQKLTGQLSQFISMLQLFFSCVLLSSDHQVVHQNWNKSGSVNLEIMICLMIW